MIRDLKTDNYPNDETPFFVLVGGAHCPKCKKAKNAIDALWQKGDLVGKRVFYVDGQRDVRMTRRLCVSSIPSLVRVKSNRAGIWTVSKSTKDIGSQKKILAYIDAGTEPAESTESDKTNTGE